MVRNLRSDIPSRGVVRHRFIPRASYGKVGCAKPEPPLTGAQAQIALTGCQRTIVSAWHGAPPAETCTTFL